MKGAIYPDGTLSQQALPVEHTASRITSLGFGKGAEAWFDWFNGRLQICVYPGAGDECEEPLIQVRYNRNGSVSEIAYNPLFKHLFRSVEADSPWRDERDDRDVRKLNKRKKREASQKIKTTVGAGVQSDSTGARELASS